MPGVVTARHNGLQGWTPRLEKLQLHASYDACLAATARSCCWCAGVQVKTYTMSDMQHVRTLPCRYSTCKQQLELLYSVCHMHTTPLQMISYHITSSVVGPLY